MRAQRPSLTAQALRDNARECRWCLAFQEAGHIGQGLDSVTVLFSICSKKRGMRRWSKPLEKLGISAGASDALPR
jgi:hypothetical protein